MTAASHARHASSEIADALDSRWLQTIGRVGWVAKGAIYAVFGLLAFRIARGTASGEADPSGAVQQIAAGGAGRFMLVGLAVGLALYALWRLACAALPGGWEASDLAKRAGYVLSALVYGALSLSSFSLARSGSKGSSGEGNDSKIQRITNDVLSHDFGRWAVAIAGVIGIGIGIGFAVYGFKRKDEKQIALHKMGPGLRKVVHYLGPVGWLARAVVTALVGVFVLFAAINYDAEKAQGFDGALRQATENGWGWLVAATGVGLIIYGAYCLVTAPYRVLRAP